jgi:hypothetical protein
MLAAEILLVVLGGVAIAGILTVCVGRLGDALIRFIGS